MTVQEVNRLIESINQISSFNIEHAIFNLLLTTGSVLIGAWLGSKTTLAQTRKNFEYQRMLERGMYYRKNKINELKQILNVNYEILKNLDLLHYYCYSLKEIIVQKELDSLEVKIKSLGTSVFILESFEVEEEELIKNIDLKNNYREVNSSLDSFIGQVRYSMTQDEDDRLGEFEDEEEIIKGYIYTLNNGLVQLLRYNIDMITK